jgi:lipopolysaccharide transport protein LptA
MKKIVICSLLTLMIAPCSAAPLGEGAFDMVNISAEEAIEDEQPGILHFKGYFLMKSSDWQLTSTRATVYGSPNRPDRVYLEGAPARFLVNRTDNEHQDPITATALVVEYLRETNKLILSGDATLVLGDEVIRSTYIEYDISTNRYQAGGTDGVSIEVPPAD